MNFSIDLPCSPPVGRYQSSQNMYSEVTSYEFYENLGTHFSIIFEEKTCTEVVHNPQYLGDMLKSIDTTL